MPPMLAKRRQLPPMQEPPYDFRFVPRCARDLSGSVVERVDLRFRWHAMLPEILLLGNEAAERHEASAPTLLASRGKPLSLEYLADRLETDDPLQGYVVRTQAEGWLQGYVTVTTFTTWARWLCWNSDPRILEDHGDPPADEAEAAWRGNRVVDGEGLLAAELQRTVFDGDADGEGVVWPRIAEVSLLASLGCGGWLIRLVLEELERHDGEYVYSLAPRSILARSRSSTD